MQVCSSNAGKRAPNPETLSEAVTTLCVTRNEIYELQTTRRRPCVLVSNEWGTEACLTYYQDAAGSSGTRNNN